jgi:hypothetical protein
MTKKETEGSCCVGLCTVKIRWQNADGNTNVYTFKAGFLADGYKPKGVNVVKNRIIEYAKGFVSSYPDFFDAKDKKIDYVANVKTFDCDLFQAFDENDFKGK